MYLTQLGNRLKHAIVADRSALRIQYQNQVIRPVLMPRFYGNRAVIWAPSNTIQL